MPYLLGFFVLSPHVRNVGVVSSNLIFSTIRKCAASEWTRRISRFWRKPHLSGFMYMRQWDAVNAQSDGIRFSSWPLPQVSV